MSLTIIQDITVARLDENNIRMLCSMDDLQVSSDSHIL